MNILTLHQSQEIVSDHAEMVDLSLGWWPGLLWALVTWAWPMMGDKSLETTQCNAMSSPGCSMPAREACLHSQRINRESERVVFKLKMDWHLNVSIKVAFETGSATLECCSVFVWSKGLVCPGCLNNHTWYSSMVSFSGPGWKLEKVPPPLSFFRSCLPNGPGFSEGCYTVVGSTNLPNCDIMI